MTLSDCQGVEHIHSEQLAGLDEFARDRDIFVLYHLPRFAQRPWRSMCRLYKLAYFFSPDKLESDFSKLGS